MGTLCNIQNFLQLENQKPYENSFLLCIYTIFILLPWYPFVSGAIQPVDFFILVATFLMISKNDFFNFKFYSVSHGYLLIALLTTYASLRAFFVFIEKHQLLNQIFSNIYYLVLCTFFLSIFVYLNRIKSFQIFYNIILNCLLFTILLPLGALFLAKLGYIKMTSRPWLTFNNANQLGFFAATNLCLFFYLNLLISNNNINIKRILSLLIINLNLIFILLSASRASAPAIILYILSYFLIFNIRITYRSYSLWILLILFSLGCFSVCLYRYSSEIGSNSSNYLLFLQNFENDFNNRAIQGIEYNFNSIIQFIFGNGFISNPLRPIGEGGLLEEFHNNFIGIFNELGLIGLLIYFYFVSNIFIKLFQKGFIYLLPFIWYLMYSEMHFAFRTRMNWLFFAMVIFVLLYKKLPDLISNKQEKLSMHYDAAVEEFK